MTLIHDGLTIAEAAAATGLSAHTLRYYERAGLMLSPVDRASSSHRRYSDADIGWVQFLTRLRWTGMPIAVMRRYTELVRQGESSVTERRELLLRQREAVQAHLEELTASMRAIDHKIEIYDKEIAHA